MISVPIFSIAIKGVPAPTLRLIRCHNRKRNQTHYHLAQPEPQGRLAYRLLRSPPRRTRSPLASNTHRSRLSRRMLRLLRHRAVEHPRRWRRIFGRLPVLRALVRSELLELSDGDDGHRVVGLLYRRVFRRRVFRKHRRTGPIPPHRRVELDRRVELIGRLGALGERFFHGGGAILVSCDSAFSVRIGLVKRRL